MHVFWNPKSVIFGLVDAHSNISMSKFGPTTVAQPKEQKLSFFSSHVACAVIASYLSVQCIFTFAIFITTVLTRPPSFELELGVRLSDNVCIGPYHS